MLDITEIILAASHRLGPVANIVMQSIKSAIWTVFFIIAVIGAVNSEESGLTIFLVLVLLYAQDQLSLLLDEGVLLTESSTA